MYDKKKNGGASLDEPRRERGRDGCCVGCAATSGSILFMSNPVVVVIGGNSGHTHDVSKLRRLLCECKCKCRLSLPCYNTFPSPNCRSIQLQGERGVRGGRGTWQPKTWPKKPHQLPTASKTLFQGTHPETFLILDTRNILPFRTNNKQHRRGKRPTHSRPVRFKSPSFGSTPCIRHCSLLQALS